MLTRRQKEVLDFVSRHIERHGVAPTLQEIGRQLKLSSVATVHKHLRKLEEKGAVRRLTHQSRALAVVPAPEVAGGARIPLLGTVAAGTPIEPIETPGTITVPEELLGRGETFALRVRGDSMIDEQIRDGDFVVIEDRKQANDGEMVIALIGGTDVTLKKLYREDGRIRLQPANPAMQPMLFESDQIQVQGVVVGVMRRY